MTENVLPTEKEKSKSRRLKMRAEITASRKTWSQNIYSKEDKNT